MPFQIGSFVKWKQVCHARLGYTVSEVGRVVRVHNYPLQDSEIDVEFGDGDVLYGAVLDWFELAEAPANQN